MQYAFQEWLQSGGVQVEGNPTVARELSEFLTRVAQCGAPYQQWCDDLRSHWNITVSGTEVLYPHEEILELR